MATRMPRMTMTTSSSMRVKPLSSRARRVLILLSIEISSDGGVDWREAPAKWLSASPSPVLRGQKGDRVPIFIPHRGGYLRAGLREQALQGRTIRWLAVGGQHELDREIEQGAEPPGDVVTRHVLATAQLDVQPVAEVGERVTGDDRPDRGQPEDEVVVLAAREGLDAEGPVSGAMEVPLALACAQPREILALHAAHPVGIDAELLDPVFPGVRRRRMHGKAEPAGVALVVRRGQHDGGRAFEQPGGNREGVEQEELAARLDGVRRDELGPPLLVVPVGVRRLPLPDTGTQLAHAGRLHREARIVANGGEVLFLGGRFRVIRPLLARAAEELERTVGVPGARLDAGEVIPDRGNVGSLGGGLLEDRARRGPVLDVACG